MDAIFLLLGLGFSLVSLVCNIIVLIDAFKKSVMTGVLCLCVPCYILYYMFVEFEHPQKPLIITGSLAGGVLGRALSGLGGGALDSRR